MSTNKQDQPTVNYPLLKQQNLKQNIQEKSKGVEVGSLRSQEFH